MCLFQSILVTDKKIAPSQESAHRSATTVDYLSELNIYSKATSVRLSGIVCTIGAHCAHGPG